MKLPIVILSTLALFTLLLPACALLMSGTTQVVTIHAWPEDATIRLLDKFYVVRNGKAQIDSTRWERHGTMAVRLQRGKPHRFAIERAGYKIASITTGQRDNAWVWADLLAPMWLGVEVDYLSGAAYDIVPDSLDVTLEKGEGVAPERIYPTSPSNKTVILVLETVILIVGLVYAFMLAAASGFGSVPFGGWQ